MCAGIESDGSVCNMGSCVGGVALELIVFSDRLVKQFTKLDAMELDMSGSVSSSPSSILMGSIKIGDLKASV